MKKIAWSWSRIETFEQCPKKFHHQNILKDVPRPSSPAMDRGRRIHKALEDAIKFGAQLPPDLARCEPIIDRIKSAQTAGAKVFAEQQLAFREDLQPTDWYNKDVWFRVIMDVAIVMGAAASIIDWKTGRAKDYTDQELQGNQLALNAMAGFLLWPDVNKIEVSYAWVDHEMRTPATFDRRQLDSLLQDFGDRAEMIQLANESGQWKATPNDYCKWCPCTKMQCIHKPG